MGHCLLCPGRGAEIGITILQFYLTSGLPTGVTSQPKPGEEEARGLYLPSGLCIFAIEAWSQLKSCSTTSSAQGLLQHGCSAPATEHLGWKTYSFPDCPLLNDAVSRAKGHAAETGRAGQELCSPAATSSPRFGFSPPLPPTAPFKGWQDPGLCLEL